MASKIKIGILGCGWLGFKLAEKLISKSFTVKGSTTSEDKIEMLCKSGIDTYKIHVTNTLIEGDIQNFLHSVNLLIINIPPKLRKNSKENFSSKIKLLVPYITSSSVKKVIFVSSTSVYPDTVEIALEEMLLSTDSENGRQLLEAENVLRNNSAFETTILRFGGLISEDRHPVFRLAGRENLPNPDTPVNLIHREDCIGIIQTIINREIWNETFNAVAPYHPTRKEYYTQKAVELQLTLPSFKGEKSTVKVVEIEKLLRMTAYDFIYPTL